MALLACKFNKLCFANLSDSKKQELLQGVKSYSDRILVEISARNSVFDYQFILDKYLHDIWHSESASHLCISDSFNIVIAFVEKNDKEFQELIEQYKMDVTRVKRKLVIICKTLHHYFKENNLFAKDLNVTEIKTMHKLVMGDLLITAGEYRTTQACPSGSSSQYAFPDEIPKRLDCLVKFCINKLCFVEDFESAILLSSFFFSEFLLIHPFQNGNGRVARILLSIFLRSFIAVPNTFDARKRYEYIEVLENRHAEPLKSPNQITTFILSEQFRSLSQLVYLVAETP